MTKEIICTLISTEHCGCRSTYSSEKSCKLTDKAPYATCEYGVEARVPDKPEAEKVENAPEEEVKF